MISRRIGTVTFGSYYYSPQHATESPFSASHCGFYVPNNFLRHKNNWNRSFMATVCDETATKLLVNRKFTNLLVKSDLPNGFPSFIPFDTWSQRSAPTLLVVASIWPSSKLSHGFQSPSLSPNVSEISTTSARLSGVGNSPCPILLSACLLLGRLSPRTAIWDCYLRWSTLKSHAIVTRKMCFVWQ